MSYPRIEGSNLKYLYDRDFSTKNIEASGSFTPSYGSKMRFRNKLRNIVGRDNYSQKAPLGLNSMVAEAELIFQNLTIEEAGMLQKAIDTQLANGVSDEEQFAVESYLTLGLGNSSPISEHVPLVTINLDGGSSTGMYIYNTLSGARVTNLDLNHKEGFLTDVALDLTINADSPEINYWGVYANSTGIRNWREGLPYEKNDIAYLPIFNNARDNFFYCVEDNTSTYVNSPTGASTVWTQSFYWEPDAAVNVSFDSRKGEESFSKGFYNRIKLDSNDRLVNAKLAFSNRSNKETRAILHFLENRMGYKKFDYILSGAYRSAKRFTADAWEHVFKFYDSNDIGIEIKEAANPVIPKEPNSYNFWNVITGSGLWWTQAGLGNDSQIYINATSFGVSDPQYSTSKRNSTYILASTNGNTILYADASDPECAGSNSQGMMATFFHKDATGWYTGASTGSCAVYDLETLSEISTMYQRLVDQPPNTLMVMSSFNTPLCQDSSFTGELIANWGATEFPNYALEDGSTYMLVAVKNRGKIYENSEAEGDGPIGFAGWINNIEYNTGLYWERYNTYFYDTVPLANHTAISSGFIDTIGYSTNLATFTDQYVGYFKTRESGRYDFRLASNNHSYFWLGEFATAGYKTYNADIYDAGGPQYSYTTASFTLLGNTYYPIRIIHGDESLTEELYFQFRYNDNAFQSGMSGYLFHSDHMLTTEYMDQ